MKRKLNSMLHRHISTLVVIIFLLVTQAPEQVLGSDPTPIAESSFRVAQYNSLDDEQLEDKLEKIHLVAAGLRTHLLIYRDEEGNMFVPLKDMETSRLMKHFNCRPTHLVPLNTIVLGFEDGSDFRMKFGDTTARMGTEEIELKTSPIIIRNIPFIPLEALEQAFRLRVSYNENTNTYYMDPIMSDVVLKYEKGKYRLIAKTTGPVKYETSILENPRRFVIDVEGVVMEESLADKDVHNNKIGTLFISQYSYNPNKVRIIIPQDKGVEVEIPGEFEDEYSVEAWLFTPQVVAPVQGLDQERISDFRVKVKDDRVVFKIVTTGPVQYEWRRLLPPDNRYFVDIPNTIYGSEFSQDFDVGYIKCIKAVQHRPLPDPVVRVTFELHVPSKIKVSPDPEHPNEIRVEILSETIDPRFVERQGFGVTQYAASGIVVCIDPGHGGSDPGACHNGMQEKQLTLDISLKLAKLLRKSGCNVILTRTSDRDVSFAGSSDSRELQSRCNIANHMNADLFISIHIDASTNSYQNGTTVYYHRSNSSLLASYIQNHLVSANGLKNNGTRQASFYVIRHTNMPAVLVECAFISNPSDASRLASSSFRQKCAMGIFNGIVAFARAKKMGTFKEINPNREMIEIANDKKAALEKKLNESDKKGSSSYSER